MLKDLPDYPFQQQTVDALRADGAKIYETDHNWYAEARSTLKALRLRRTAEVKLRLSYMTPHAAVELSDGQCGFVPRDHLQAFVDACEDDEVLVWTVSRRSNEPQSFFPWHEATIQLMVLSRHPSAMDGVEWLCGEFIPAMNRHGWYNPTTNHEPPPSRLLDAIETKERGRALLNDLVPGLGDLLAEPREGG